MGLFHKHNFTHVGYRTEYAHLTEKRNWRRYGKDVCPYPGCTKRVEMFMCRCGQTKEVEVDLKND